MRNFLHRINSWLASAIATLNAVLAVSIVLLTALGIAITMAASEEGAAAQIGLGVLGFILGILLGVILAIAICGVIAVLLDIRQVLIDTRDQMP